MRILFAILFSLSLTACRFESDTMCDPSELLIPVKPDEETWFLTKEIIKAINIHATELEFEKEIWLEHSYAIREDNGKFYIWVDYTTQATLDIPAARRLSVYVILSLLDQLNSNPTLVAAQGGDFTPDDLYFSVEYTSFYGVYDDPLLVGRAELKYGFMNVFYAHDCFHIDPVIYHKHSEPFETSVLIVRTQRETVKRLRPLEESIYDSLTAPVDWMSGQPQYVREPRDVFDEGLFELKSTITNYPSEGEQLKSGRIEGYDEEKSRSTNYDTQKSRSDFIWDSDRDKQ